MEPIEILKYTFIFIGIFYTIPYLITVGIRHGLGKRKVGHTFNINNFSSDPEALKNLFNDLIRGANEKED